MRAVLIIEEEKITIQKSEYIEDGWYIEVVKDKIDLYEIPLFGGEPTHIGTFDTLIGAIKKANSLT